MTFDFQEVARGTRCGRLRWPVYFSLSALYFTAYKVYRRDIFLRAPLVVVVGI